MQRSSHECRAAARAAIPPGGVPRWPGRATAVFCLYFHSVDFPTPTPPLASVILREKSRDMASASSHVLDHLAGLLHAAPRCSTAQPLACTSAALRCTVLPRRRKGAKSGASVRGYAARGAA